MTQSLLKEISEDEQNIQADGTIFRSGDSINMIYEKSGTGEYKFSVFLNLKLIIQFTMAKHPPLYPEICMKPLSDLIYLKSGIAGDKLESGSQKFGLDSLTGKKLEAIDKQNPNLCCVATIEEVDREKNRIRVHFDGWTNRYDYWTETEDLALFPAGYMRFMKKCQKTVPYTFEKPRGINIFYFDILHLDSKFQTFLLGYKNLFVWEDYLEVHEPVSFDFFSKEQKHGMHLKDFPIYRSEASDCMKTESNNPECKYLEFIFIIFNKLKRRFFISSILLINVINNFSYELNISYTKYPQWSSMSNEINTFIIPKFFCINNSKYLFEDTRHIH